MVPTRVFPEHGYAPGTGHYIVCCICNTQVQRDTGLWQSAEYSTFSISDEVGKYQLTVAGYSGDAGDAMLATDSQHIADGAKFSTPGSDNDQTSSDCAGNNDRGWWDRACTTSCLNKVGTAQWKLSTDVPHDVQHSHMLVKIK